MMSEESGVVCTGEVKAFRESRKKQFDRKCECDKWDFLAGVGPSAIRREVRTISCCLTFPRELRLRYARPPPLLQPWFPFTISSTHQILLLLLELEQAAAREIACLVYSCG